MKKLLYSTLQCYASTISAQEPLLLQRLRQETISLPGGAMISPPLQGRLFSLLSQLLAPQKILEIGTFTGYSTLCLAEGLQQKGKLYSLDKNGHMQAIARRYIEEAGKSEQVILVEGDAKKTIPTIPYPLDMIFIDADKKNYTHYYNIVMPMLRHGGLIIADNVFWHGNVLDKEQMAHDPRTQALVTFTQTLQQDPRLEIITLPIGDGLLVRRKL